jgi:hypothetical protein
MPDIEQLIRSSRPAPDQLPPLDLDHVHRRARRQAVTQTAGRIGGAAVAAVAVALVVVTAGQPVGLRIDDPTGPTTTPTTATSAPEVDTQRATIERQLTAARQARDERREMIAEIEEQVALLPDTGADRRRDDLTDQLDRLRGQLAQLDARIADLEAGLAQLGRDGTTTQAPVAVLDVVGLSEAEARAALHQLGLDAKVRPGVTTSAAQAGLVVAQDPAAGAMVTRDNVDTPTDESTTIMLTVGTSPEDANDPTATGWYTDNQRPDDTTGLVPAWFVPEPVGGPPGPAVRYWRPMADHPLTRDEQARLSVQALALTPPPGTQTAFAQGLTVHDVTLDDEQVRIDLDGDSTGLHGHGSYGLMLGSDQLVALAVHHYPDATTLCIAYDGVPTSAGGPPFLHDAQGCPIDLP